MHEPWCLMKQQKVLFYGKVKFTDKSMKINKLYSSIACATFAVVVTSSAHAMPVPFDFAGAGGDLNTNTLVDGGVTAESFYWDGDGSAWLPADLFQRNTANDNGLGVCSPPETACQDGTGNDGGGNVNELSNQTVYEVIRLDKGGVNNTKWAELWVSSLDSSEVGTLFWGNSSGIDSLLAGNMFSYDTSNFTGVEGDILSLAVAAGFNNTAQYVLFTPGTTALATGPDNDYLVWKGITDDSIPPSGVVPVPAAVWLFGSGLLGLVGIARRRKA